MFDWFKPRARGDRKPLPAPRASLEPVAATPDRDALRGRAHAAVARSDFVEAERSYRAVIALDERDVSAWVGLGFALSQQRLASVAVEALQRAIALQPDEPDAHHMLGGLYDELAQPEHAMRHWRVAMAAPGFSIARRELARVLVERGRVDEARALIDEGIEQNPRFADFHFYRGNFALTACEFDQARTSFADAVSFDPNHASAWLALARLQRRIDHLDEAIASYRALLAIQPGSAIACELGGVWQAMHEPAHAVEAFELAIRLSPSDAKAHNLLANALVGLDRPAEAITMYKRATTLDPRFTDAFVNMGNVLNVLRRPIEAIAAYEKARAIDPAADWVCGNLLHTRMGLCDWRGIEVAFADLAARIDRGERAATPFTVLAAPLSAMQQRRCAATWVAATAYPTATDRPAPPAHQRLRIGYFSADFHSHATSYLMAELFERHDRTRFESIAFSFGPVSSHPMRTRLVAAFDRFIEVGHLSDAGIAARARELEVDIAVDLKGFTQDSRPGVFAQRPAPLNVCYLGYPGTMATTFIDYLIADATLIPNRDAEAYSEQIVYLPDSYQVNDRRRDVAERTPTRAACGLPAEAFVFACFNNPYKITPDVFDVWMGLLRALPHGVLWLLAEQQQTAANLRAEAVARGVDGTRLVFASRAAVAEHLARQRVADLFLDTLYCNAHTTASDALWVGLPVLTCLGRTFAGRVAGSLVRAAGLPELAVETLDDYARLALELAIDAPRLSALRARLATDRMTCALFDAGRFAAHLEAAYLAMWDRHRAGIAPAHLRIARLNASALP